MPWSATLFLNPIANRREFKKLFQLKLNLKLPTKPSISYTVIELSPSHRNTQFQVGSDGLKFRNNLGTSLSVSHPMTKISTKMLIFLVIELYLPLSVKMLTLLLPTPTPT